MKIDYGPPPPADLGRNLNTIEDARRWLLHPSNWLDSQFWIIRWDGIVPKIRESRAKELIAQPHDTGLFEVVVIEQRRMKNRAKAGLPIEDSFE